MNVLDQLTNLIEENKKLKKEKRELARELKFAKEIEMEAVRRYTKVADELLIYYIKYGIIDIKERKKYKK
jgi:capsule polysaccharide export protein KpsE/RkpR